MQYEEMNSKSDCIVLQRRFTSFSVQIHTIRIITFLLVLSSVSLSAQTIKSAKGFDNDIGVVIAMLDDLKERVTRSVAHLSQEETDFLLDGEANRIGTLIMHLAATEKYYQLYTFQGTDFNREEQKTWGVALDLGEDAREKFQGHPASHYLKIWDEVREETKRLLKTKDDKWFGKKVKGSSMNNHWAWYHVMEHQANHMGQIRLIIKRIN